MADDVAAVVDDDDDDCVAVAVEAADEKGVAALEVEGLAHPGDEKAGLDAAGWAEIGGELHDVGGLAAGAMTSMVLIVELFSEGVEEEKTSSIFAFMTRPSFAAFFIRYWAILI